MNNQQQDYNEEPVTYCKRCHSLNIITGDGFPDYCDDCGSTDLEEESIYEWLAQKQEIEDSKPKEKHLF
jgi:hypothetical protein